MLSHSSAQLIYLSHGGGPLPILGDLSHQSMVAFMQGLSASLHKPDAILVISAHWEEREATLLSSSNPPLLYDYYGFPREAYQLTYPAPGNPTLAARIAGMLEQAAIPTRLDDQRGFDHGLFIPLKLVYPGVEFPCLQLSLLAGLDPAAHLALGAALRPLLAEKLLIVGSGFSFHNMNAFNWGGAPAPDPRNDQFQDWLIETCTSSLDWQEREKRLLHWEQAPHARYCHPRQEHLMPLHVCQGMAQQAGRLIFDDLILGKRSVAFLW